MWTHFNSNLNPLKVRGAPSAGFTRLGGTSASTYKILLIKKKKEETLKLAPLSSTNFSPQLVIQCER